MGEEEIEVPIYLITGFLDSGKTTFLNFTVRQDYFMIEEPTLLITTEEGEEEYDEKDLLRYNTVLETIENPEDLTVQTLRAFQRKYNPSRVIVEYNPLWGCDKFRAMKMPSGWGIVQEIVIVDAGTFQVYQTNMKSLFAEMSRGADMVLFNRASTDMPLASFRRNFKVVNPAVDVQYVDADNEPIDIFEDSVPYDLDGDVITIEDVDYGIFYVDAQDNPDRYRGKTVHFKGKVLKSKDKNADYFMPARTVMTCCAADMQYIGFVCRTENASKLKAGRWVDVTAKVGYEYVEMAQQEEPVLTAESIAPAEPPAEEIVYFN